MRAKFLRRFEHVLHERKYVGVEFLIEGSREATRTLVPLKTDENGQLVPDEAMIATVRRLRRRQEVYLTYYVHQKWTWIRSVTPVPPK